MSENNKDVLLPLPPEEDDGMLIGSVVNGDLYMLRAAHTVLFSSPPCRRPTVSLENVMPQRPKTAFFTPARSVFEALTNTDIDASEIHCLQKKRNGEVIITFRSISSKEKLLRLSSLKVNSENLAVQDIDRPLTFLTIYNVPFKLSDLAII